MKNEKTTLIKPKKIQDKEKNKIELVGAITLFIIGFILFTNSSQAIIIVCYFIGSIILLFGGYNLIRYYSLKKELNIESNINLISGVISIFMGIIIILLASAIETFLRFIIGIILIYNGISKIKNSLDYNNYFILTLGIIFVGMGLYTILAENIILALCGIILMIASILDIIKYIKSNKK